MFDVITMPRNWPVEVNYHEAKAFCKWKGDGYRILSEAEHNAIRGIQVPEMNINLVYSSSTVRKLLHSYLLALIIDSKYK